MQTGGNFPGGNVRTTYTDYNPGYTAPWPAADPWILDLYTERSVTEGGVTAKSQYCFDAATGFLARVRELKGASPGANDVIKLFAPDGQGNVMREMYYGGDLQSVGTGSLCSLTLTDEQYRIDHTYVVGVLESSQYYDADGQPLSYKTVDLTIDPSTGLASESRDPAGLVTAYEYDAMGRLVWVKPEAGHDGWTQYVYTPASSATEPAKVQILRRPNGSETGTALARSEYHFDGFGRVWKERRLMPGLDWSTRETRYNAMGWKSQVSEYATGEPANWTLYLDYDPFGRPGTVRPPDGEAHDVELVYTGVRVVKRKVKVGTAGTGPANITETVAVTTEKYDRHGRLFKVVEPSGAGGSDVVTTYTYDVGNRLTQVSSTAGEVTQVRKFTYDKRGFLTSEQHPEKGPNGNGLVNYFDYDARGHAHRRQDTPNDLTYEYDRAERLVTVKETWSGRLLKEFTYATANAAGDWRNGKLLSASRYNYVSNVPSDRIFADGFETGDVSAWSDVGEKSLDELGDFTVKIVQTNVYGGRGGRVSQRDLQAVINGTPAESFTQSWTYNDLGAVETIGYPECTFTECAGDAASPRTVTFAYTRGYLTAVPGYASSITYHASGLVNQIAHTNGVTVTQANDPNGMLRPASITAKKGTTTLWSTGDYRYDGAGNITAIGTSWFLYDPVSRLVSATLYTGTMGGGTPKLRTYAYDAFGNIQQIGGTSGRATPTKSQTNRLEGTAVYDSAGNLTSWNGNYYQYDAFNQMSRIHAGGEEWLYLYTADDERVWHYKIGANPRFDRWTLRDRSGKVLREYTAEGYSWNVAKDYIHRGGVLLAGETSQGATHFHLDHLGTPRLITNTTGMTSAYHLYYPFGEEITAYNQDTERMKFTGHERDLGSQASSGDDMDYMHARHCNPLVARFVSVDPKTQYKEVQKPHIWNRYIYAAGNPLKYIDPNGEDLYLVYDFSQSGLSGKLQIALARGVRDRFKRAGVKNVRTVFKGSFRPSLKRSTDKQVNINVVQKNLDHDGSTVFENAKRNNVTASTFHAPGAAGSEAFMNFLINTTTHGAGHGTGALPRYQYDGLRPGALLFPRGNQAEPGTIMETDVQPAMLGAELRDFSVIDAEALQEALNEPIKEDQEPEEE